MLFDDRIDIAICLLLGCIMAGAAHSVSSVPGHMIYAVLCGATSLASFITGICLSVVAIRRSSSAKSDRDQTE